MIHKFFKRGELKKLLIINVKKTRFILKPNAHISSTPQSASSSPTGPSKNANIFMEHLLVLEDISVQCRSLFSPYGRLHFERWGNLMADTLGLLAEETSWIA